MRGMGRVFQRKGSPFWWVSYYHRGQEMRLSSRSTDYKVAEKFLKQELAKLGAERLGLKPYVSPKQERVMVSELLDALERDYEIRRKATEKFKSHLKPVRVAFSDLRAVGCTPELIDRMVSSWLEEGKAPGTVNRRMQLLRQAFKLAVEHNRITWAPKVRRLPNADRKRTGFFERAEFEAVVQHLPEDLQDFARFAYLTGWRKGEIASLEWADVDLSEHTIHLKAENSKNRESRKVALEGELGEIIQRRLAKKAVITESGILAYRLVFHRNGEPVRDFRKVWAAACNKAGVQGRIFHDLRRSAIRNMVRAGVPESVAMKVSGHKTASVFRRYDISSDDDVREAMRLTQAYIKSLPADQKHGQNTDKDR